MLRRPQSESPVDVVVVATGAANLASVREGMLRCGARPRIAESAEDVQNARAVVLPGVGAFGAAMTQLAKAPGLLEALRVRLREGRPTLAICLGLQLLAAASDESPGVAGLGIVDVPVKRFDDRSVRVPQLGWNHVSTDSGCRLVASSGYASFANSYMMRSAPAGWAVAWSSYGGQRFVAAMERGAVIACQFHPELSGPWGLDLMRRWLDLASGSDVRAGTVESVQQRDRAATVHQGGLTRRLIPCLDVRDGRVVKGVRFSNLRDSGDPADLARAYEESGADEIVVLDVSATPEERSHQYETVERVRAALSIPLTVGGGVRTVDDAAALLDAGADKVGVNTAAVREPNLIAQLADRFGRQCTVVAIDAARRTIDRAEAGSMVSHPAWEVVVRSGTDRRPLDACTWAAEAVARGAGEILLTSWDRDGTREGYDTELIRAVRNVVTVPIIASGGASTPAHLLEALQSGADAVLAASIFHEREWTCDALKGVLAAEGVEVRR